MPRFPVGPKTAPGAVCSAPARVARVASHPGGDGRTIAVASIAGL